MRFDFLLGAYQSRSVIAAAQRCVNLYPESNPEGANGKFFPTTLYPTPGSRLLLTGAGKCWRCLYTSTDNRLFGVLDDKAVLVNQDMTVTVLGTVGDGLEPAYMADNGLDLLIVDGSAIGYKINLESLKLSQVANQAFYGSTRIVEVDGYLVLNRPKTNQWYISLFQQIDFDSLDFASKIGSSDLLVCIGVTRRNLFLFGEQTTEVWTNTGGTDFTFSRIPGAFLQFGCKAPHSLCQADGSLYWVSQSPQGDCMVLRTMNYDRERISTFAIENELQNYPRVDDAIGYIHQMSGHYWYVLTFPTANKTWVYDIATDQWHERLSLDDSGILNRHRGNCFSFWRGMHVVGDFSNGRLYELDLDVYTDAGKEIRRIRSLPHISDNGNRVAYRSFQADMEAGRATDPAKLPEIRLRWSDTKGASWSTHISSNIGARGDYAAVARFNRLGMARDRVFELSWAADCKTALNGAYIDMEAGQK